MIHLYISDNRDIFEPCLHGKRRNVKIRMIIYNYTKSQVIFSLFFFSHKKTSFDVFSDQSKKARLSHKQNKQLYTAPSLYEVSKILYN